MAPVVWTSERVARLFRLVIGDLKVDYDKIARLWSQKYPDDDYKPTARAIKEEIAILKKGAGSETTTKATDSPKTPQSSKKRASTKTPTGSNKKARFSEMSDQDDSDGVDIGNFRASPTPRKAPDRHSKKLSTPYREMIASDSDDGDLNEVKQEKVGGEHLDGDVAETKDIHPANSVKKKKKNLGHSGVSISLDTDEDSDDGNISVWNPRNHE